MPNAERTNWGELRKMPNAERTSWGELRKMPNAERTSWGELRKMWEVCVHSGETCCLSMRVGGHVG